MRNVGLLLVLLFVLMFAVLTVLELAQNGATPLGVLSALVVAMFAIGLLGAFRPPPSS